VRWETFIMQSSDPKNSRGELIQLLERQLEALQKECFGAATESDLQEYEGRRDRIGKLCDELFEQKSA
jgi:hypothetical protein